MKRPKEEKSVTSTNLFGILSDDDKDCIDKGESHYDSSISMLSEEEEDKGDKDERDENVGKAGIIREILQHETWRLKKVMKVKEEMHERDSLELHHQVRYYERELEARK